MFLPKMSLHIIFTLHSIYRLIVVKCRTTDIFCALKKIRGTLAVGPSNMHGTVSHLNYTLYTTGLSSSFYSLRKTSRPEAPLSICLKGALYKFLSYRSIMRNSLSIPSPPFLSAVSGLQILLTSYYSVGLYIYTVIQ